MTYLLKYSDVYDDARKDAIEYLKNIPFEEIKRIIPFKHNNTLRLNNFFSDNDLQNDVNQIISKLRYEEIDFISDIGYLKIIEIILSQNQNITNQDIDINEFEKNIFKAFLSINEDLEEKENFGLQYIKRLGNISSEENFAYSIFLNKFISADTEEDRDNNDLIKYIYSTVYKLEKLFIFLKVKGLNELKRNLIAQFSFNDESELIQNIHQLLYTIFIATKIQNSNEFNVLKEKDVLFFDSLISDNVEIDEDFKKLKETPIVKLSDNHYTYFDYLFVVDRFYKGIKFNILKAFNDDVNLIKKYGDFFSFYNLEFSEKHLFHSICDDIFKNGNYIVLERKEKEEKFEPDYYVRNKKSNDIFIFECKDVMIAGKVKESRHLEKLIKALEEKFITPKGIQQLTLHIEKIINNEFKFDNKLNYGNSNKIYPILVLCERIFDIHGLNFILNEYYKKQIRDKLGINYDSARIKDLVIIDIDTLISSKNYLLKNDTNFQEWLDLHISEMNKKFIPSNSQDENLSKLLKCIAPFSWRKRINLSEEMLNQFTNYNKA